MIHKDHKFSPIGNPLGEDVRGSDGSTPGVGGWGLKHKRIGSGHRYLLPLWMGGVSYLDRGKIKWLCTSNDDILS